MKHDQIQKTFVFILVMLFNASLAFGFSLQPVYPYGDMPMKGSVEKIGDTVRICLAQGEMHQGAVAVCNDGDDAEYIEFAAVLNLDKQSPLNKEAIKLSRIVHLPWWKNTKKIHSSDQLLPVTSADTIGCPKGSNRYLWITVDGRKLKAGTYKAQLMLETLIPSIQNKTIDIVIDVWPFSLEKDLPVKIFTWDYGIATNSDQWFEHFRAYKINSWHVPVSAPLPRITPEGELETSPDFNELRPILKRGRLTGGEFLIETWCFRNKPWKVTDGTELAYMSDGWKKAFGKWFEAFLALMKSYDLDYKDWLWYPFDENMSAEFLEQIEFMRKLDPKVRFFVDCCPSFAVKKEDAQLMRKWVGKIDVWCPMFKHLETADMDLIRSDKSAELWAYFCGRGMRNHNPTARYRSCGWYGWKYGLDGISFWTPTVRDRKGDTKLEPVLSEGTGVVWMTPRGLVSTRRWEAWRDGLEDYQYLLLLKQKADKAAPEDKMRLLKKLDSLVNRVYLQLRKNNEKRNKYRWYKSSENINNDAILLDKIRKEIARELIGNK